MEAQAAQEIFHKNLSTGLATIIAYIFIMHHN